MPSMICRHAMRQRSSMVLWSAGAKTPNRTILLTPHRLGIESGLHSSCRCLQAATPPVASTESSVYSSPGGEKWKGGGGSGSKGARMAGIAFFSSLVGGTACLGTWQTMRYHWKVDLIESRKARMALEPVDLPEGLPGAALADTMDTLDNEADGKGVKGPNGETLGGSEEGRRLLEQLEGRRLRVTGVFDHSKEVLVGPRGAPPGTNATSGPTSMATSPMGDFVHTPLKRGDGSTVLVNRGWVPRSRGRDWRRPEGEVTLVGVLKTAEKRGTFSPDNKPSTGQLLWAEKDALLEAAGCLKQGDGFESCPILMEAVAEHDGDRRATPMAKRPRQFGEFYVSPQTHLTYAATWYTLAAAGCVLTWFRFRRRGPTAFPKTAHPGGNR